MPIGHNADIVQVILKNAEGALSEAQDIMQKMHEMAVMVVNEMGTDADRLEMMSEMTSEAMVA